MRFMTTSTFLKISAIAYLTMGAPVVILDDGNDQELKADLGKSGILEPKMMASIANAYISNWPPISPNQGNYEVVYFPQNKASANSYDMANMLCMVNNLRKAKGLVPVVYHGQLLRLAQRHAQFQSRYRVVTHADNAGQIGDRLSALGFQWDVLVENVGAGVDNDTEIVNAWAKSPSHLHNILNPDVRFMGVDVSSGYWVQDFASPREKTYVVPTNQIDACPNQYNLQIYN